MATDPRPLSPHLGIYRWGWTMSLSILHRGTGVVLSFGTVLVALWLLALAAGPERFAQAQSLLASPLGLVVLGGWTFALSYHLCNGIRHLFWDLGMGFQLHHARRSGALVVVASLSLTALVWLLGLGLLGGGA